MKEPGRSDKSNNNQLERAIHITRYVKTQLIIILALSFAAIATAILGINPTVRANNSPLADFFLGLSGNLIVAVIIFLFLEQGIKSLHPISETRNLPYSEFIGNVRRTKNGERIRILETYSSLINERYTEIANALTDAIKQGAEVEILLFHPYSAGAKMRTEQLKGRANVAEGIRKNLAHLYELRTISKNISKKGIQVRLYSALPSIQMYRWSEWAYVSLFPIRNRSDRGPNLKVPMDNPFGSYIDDTFEDLWKGTDEAPTISLDAHMCLQLSVSANIASPAYFFAYDEHNEEVDKTRCYIVTDSNILFFSVYEFVQEKESVTFLLDDIEWKAEPHVLNPKDPNELDEYMHGRELIRQRYGWNNERLEPNPLILRFNNIKEVTD